MATLDEGPSAYEGKHVPGRIAIRARGPAHRAGSIWVYGIFALVGVVILAILAAESRHPWGVSAARQAAPTTQESLARGAALYQQNCAICHGVNGDGNGVAANVLDPKPRDFRIGKYRFVSSANGVPYRQDVIRSIQHGLAGTSMPAWLHLTDDELGAVADHVMLISRQSLKERLRTKLFANSKLKPEALEKKLNKTVDDRL